MEERNLDPGDYAVTWTTSGHDPLVAEIRVTDTGVTCLSVSGGGCFTTTPPGVTITAFTVTGHIKPKAEVTCTQSFKVTDSQTGYPIAGATLQLTRGISPSTTNSSGRCTVQLETGKRYGWSVIKDGYKTGYPPYFTACSAEKTIQLKPIAAAAPPDAVKFKLSEIVENRLPEWIAGYACAHCSGTYGYKPPTGYKVTVCKAQSVGSHGCCSSCAVVLIRCEQEGVVPGEPPVGITAWIDETGVHNLTRKHWMYVYDLHIGANAAADALYSVLSPKPSRIPASLATRKIWMGLYNYSIGAFAAGNALSGGNYPT